MFTTLLLALATSSEVPAGAYVEARTAAVYAGACHYGSQYTTQGRDAVLGWHFDRGSFDGVSLAGFDLVVALSGDRNLNEPDAKVRSIVYLDGDEPCPKKHAAIAWLKKHHGRRIGRIVEFRDLKVEVERREDTFRLVAGGDVELIGNALPERECCKMPYNVWYEPFSAVQGRLVGQTETFRFENRKLERSWSRPDENSVFFGTFGPEPTTLAQAR